MCVLGGGGRVLVRHFLTSHILAPHAHTDTHTGGARAPHADKEDVVRDQCFSPDGSGGRPPPRSSCPVYLVLSGAAACVVLALTRGRECGERARQSKEEGDARGA